MKIITTKYLKVRVGKPRLNAPSYQYLAPESEVEVDGKLYAGDETDGNDQWYKDRADNYYWSGGAKAAVNTNQPTSIEFDKLIDYTQRIQTKVQLPRLEGDGIVVGLLDSGVDENHPNLKDSVIFSKSFVQNEAIGSNDTGHGTMMAGLITGNTNSGVGIKGIAKNSKILDLKVIKNNGSTDINALKEALIYIIEDKVLKPNILNLSLSIPSISQIKEYLDEIIQKGILIVGAGGDSNIFNYNKTSVLAQHAGIIAVGAVTKAYMKNRNPIFPENLDFYFHNSLQWSTNKAPKLYEQVKGDSIYTAIVTGLLARQLASYPKRNYLESLNKLAFSKADFQSEFLKLYIP
ncbi:S8 family serine peptidase [Marivirga sp. S37H4]|uniref:S8 family serine peptidase n=1 Tax=Marivirga aurantiaca TaxID=2802615 RepID=A0A934WWI5_9BACT|nr:S8 family serine peptidase [Marivirga aurantiaca]MBK6264383.1 S8 family serine peptidase [Marivirga aurantiaca]